MRQKLQENEKYPIISFELAKGNKERHGKRRDPQQFEIILNVEAILQKGRGKKLSLSKLLRRHSKH